MNVKAAYFACSVSALTVTTSTIYMTKGYKDELYYFEKNNEMLFFCKLSNQVSTILEYLYSVISIL